MADKQRGWAENVQLTIPWQRFAQLTSEGVFDKEELAQLSKEGRIALVDDFKAESARKDPKDKAGKDARARPKNPPAGEQRGKKRSREAADRKSVRSCSDQGRQPRALESQVKNEVGEDSDDWGEWSARDQLPTAHPPAAVTNTKKETLQYPIGSARRAESWLSYN